jgi:hypothetical protein
VKTAIWIQAAIAASVFTSGCSTETIQALLSAQLAAQSRGGTQDEARNTQVPGKDAAGVKTGLAAPSALTGPWYVCGNANDRFEFDPVDLTKSDKITGVPYRAGKPAGRLEGRIVNDRLKLTAYMTIDEFGKEPVVMDFQLEGDVLRDLTNNGPTLSRKIQSGICGGSSMDQPGGPVGATGTQNPEQFANAVNMKPDMMGSYSGSGTSGSYQPPPSNTYSGTTSYQPPPSNTYSGTTSYQPPPSNTYSGTTSYPPPPNGSFQPPPNNTYSGTTNYQPPPDGSFQPPPDGSFQPPPNNTYSGTTSYQPPPDGSFQPPPNNTYSGSFTGTTSNYEPPKY